MSAGGNGGDAAGGGGAGGAGDPGAGGGDGSGGSMGNGASGGILPGTDGYDCSPKEGTFAPGDLDLEEVVDGLDTPIFITHPPNDPRLFVVEQDGTIQVIEDGAVADAPFLDIADKVASPADSMMNFERGLLGLAFHPNYAQNGLFFVHYSDSAGDTTIAEYKVSSDPQVADAASERILLTVDQPNVNHNGGSIVFGSDGYLYIGLGDGGGSYDSSDNGQNPATLLGTLLRIDPLASGDEPYTTPAGNLIDTLPSAAPEVWDYGLRNPYRFAFDACTGDLAIGDVGQDNREEVDFENAGEGHKNYGWPIMEGTICTPPGMNAQPPAMCGDTSELTMPLFDYQHGAGAPAVVAGATYRGAEFPALRGTLFFADYGEGRLWFTSYDRTAGSIAEPTEVTTSLGTIGGPASIQNGSDGEVYITAAQEGTVLKIVLSN